MATKENQREVTCPNAQRAEALHGIKHKPALILKGDRLFLEREWNGAFVVWQQDGSIALVDEKNPAKADGYDASSIREILVWCAYCNRDSIMNFRRSEEENQLETIGGIWRATASAGDIEIPIRRMVVRDARGTTIVEDKPDTEDTTIRAIDARSDYFAQLPFEVFSYPSENSLLNKCWEKAWKFGFDAFSDDTLDAFVGLNEKDRKIKAHEIRMNRRYDLSIGRNAFRSLFSDHLDDVKAQL